MPEKRKEQPCFSDKEIFSAPLPDMKKIYHILDNTPDVRFERVLALKKLIETGQYHVSNDALAEKMIKESLLELKK